MSKSCCLFHDTNPTAAELCNVLGTRWAICANTEKNRQRYGRCLTHKQYEQASQEALELREFPNTTITERAVFGKNFGARLIAMRRAA